MVTTLCCLARSWMALPEPGSRSVMSRTPMPALIMAWAWACIVVALPLALSMMQFRLNLIHILLISFGSPDVHRGDDAVSGRSTPTLLFFVAGVFVPPLLQAASPVTTSTAATVAVRAERAEMRIAAGLL